MFLVLGACVQRIFCRAWEYVTVRLFKYVCQLTFVRHSVKGSFTNAFAHLLSCQIVELPNLA